MRARYLLASATLLVAQAPLAATLSGTVTEEEGNPLSQVEVILIKADNNLVVKTVRSGASGDYRMNAVAGSYRMRASRTEYADAWVEDITLGDSDRVVDITMTPQVFADDKAVPSSDDCN